MNIAMLKMSALRKIEIRDTCPSGTEKIEFL